MGRTNAKKRVAESKTEKEKRKESATERDRERLRQKNNKDRERENERKIVRELEGEKRERIERVFKEHGLYQKKKRDSSNELKEKSESQNEIVKTNGQKNFKRWRISGSDQLTLTRKR